MRFPLRSNIFLFMLVLLSFFTGYTILLVTNSAHPNILNIVVWSILGIISESKAVYLAEGNIYASTTEAVFVLSFLISGPAGSLVVITASTLFWIGKTENGYTNILKTPVRYTIFNISHFIIILGIVTVFYRAAEGTFNGTLHILPAVIVSPMFFILSCVFNAFFYKLEDETPFFEYLTATFKEYLPGALMVSLSGIMTAFAYQRFNILSILLFAVPLLLTRITFTTLSEPGR